MAKGHKSMAVVEIKGITAKVQGVDGVAREVQLVVNQDLTGELSLGVVKSRGEPVFPDTQPWPEIYGRERKNL